MLGRWWVELTRRRASSPAAASPRSRSRDRWEPELRPVTAIIDEVADRWSVPALPKGVRVVASSRMTRALARAYPRRHTIRISTRVLEAADADLLREVVIHEAAHLACYLKHGSRVRPHGREWKELMRQAGYEPRVRFDSGSIAGMPAPRQRPRVFEHSCPVCGWRQMARTTNRRWRCAICVGEGREGGLVVRRVGGKGSSARGATA